MEQELREAILRRSDASRLREVIRQQGSEGLAADAMRHVRAGRTSLEEMRRVVGTEGGWESPGVAGVEV